jgi:hypothetical protein
LLISTNDIEPLQVAQIIRGEDITSGLNRSSRVVLDFARIVGESTSLKPVLELSLCRLAHFHCATIVVFLTRTSVSPGDIRRGYVPQVDSIARVLVIETVARLADAIIANMLVCINKGGPRRVEASLDSSFNGCIKTANKLVASVTQCTTKLWTVLCSESEAYVAAPVAFTFFIEEELEVANDEEPEV